jgi:D-amino-acid dehydrogenase
MVEMKADTVVLGAGMVGVVATLQLQERGRDVVLTDRHDVAGEESSFGNTVCRGAVWLTITDD